MYMHGNVSVLGFSLRVQLGTQPFSLSLYRWHGSLSVMHVGLEIQGVVCPAAKNDLLLCYIILHT